MIRRVAELVSNLLPRKVAVTRIRLTKKFAAILNGVDVSTLRVGDVVALPDRLARMMIAEGWAEPVRESRLADVFRHNPQSSNLMN